MSVTQDLAIPYHGATSTELDAPAAVQMILDQIGATPLPGQADIYAVIRAYNTEADFWYSDPDGVTTALNRLKPTTFAGSFVSVARPIEHEGSRHITFTLYHYQVATATLVYNGGHWVVVKGVQTDVDPMANANYSIDGFWIHNPWPGDSVLGAPSQDVWVSYSSWVSTYFTPVAYGPTGGTWLDRFVSVCDPTVPTIGALKAVARRPRADGQRLLPHEKALECLRLEINDLGLTGNAVFAEAWRRGQPASPMLIQRADRADTLSYLFPWRDERAVLAVMELDARFGTLREFALFTRPALYPGMSREEVMHRLMEGVLEVTVSSPRQPGDRARERRLELVLRPGTWCLQEALLWQPCWESRSPLFPFYVLSAADRQFYISSWDGVVYDRLHPFERSGRVNRGGA